MANRYDDETMKFIETRKRVAHMRREEARRKRNIMIAIIAAVVILVVIIVIAATSCGCGSSSSEKESTTAKTTSKETATEPEPETEAEDETEDSKALTEGAKAYTTDGVNLRAEASAESELLDTLQPDTEVTVIAIEDDWVKVDYNDQEGYIKKDYLSKKKGSSSNDSGVEETTESSGDSGDNGERTIETRKRTIDAETKKSSSGSSGSGKKKTNDKRTMYGNN